MKIRIDRRFKASTRQRYRRKIIQALEALRSSGLKARDREIVGLLREIRCSAALGSGVKLEAGIFYLGRQMLEKASDAYLASAIAHDAYHVHQYRNRLDGYQMYFKTGQVSGKAAASIERGALEFQIAVGRRLGLSDSETEYLERLMAKPYYYRIPQSQRDW